MDGITVLRRNNKIGGAEIALYLIFIHLILIQIEKGRYGASLFKENSRIRDAVTVIVLLKYAAKDFKTIANLFSHSIRAGQPT